MILIKMGGSVITDKSTPLSFRGDAVVALAKAVKEVAHSEPVILVHGGGSFGHHYSVVHDMHTRPASYDLAGFAVVRNSMVHLHHLVLDALIQGGVVPYSCPPTILVRSADAPHTDALSGDGMIDTERVLEASTIAGSGLTPVAYGDAVWCGEGTSRIISGDEIMVMLARLLDVRLAVFATDVDGLYASLESGRMIPRVAAGEAGRILAGGGAEAGRADGGADVTGGMARKVKSAGDISGMGTDVLFVNGNKPRRIADIANGRYEGTLFAGGPRRTGT